MAATNSHHDAHAPSEEQALPEVVWLTPEEGRTLFDEKVRATLGISDEAFIRRFDAGI